MKTDGKIQKDGHFNGEKPGLPIAAGISDIFYSIRCIRHIETA